MLLCEPNARLLRVKRSLLQRVVSHHDSFSLGAVEQLRGRFETIWGLRPSGCRLPSQSPQVHGMPPGASKTTNRPCGLHTGYPPPMRVVKRSLLSLRQS